MKFMIIHKTDGTPATPEMAAGIGAFMQEQAQAGVLLAAEGLEPNGPRRALKRSGTGLSVTDAPFAEAKELIGGFAIVQARSIDEAMQMAAQFAAVCTHATSIEVHRVCDYGGGQD